MELQDCPHSRTPLYVQAAKLTGSGAKAWQDNPLVCIGAYMDITFCQTICQVKIVATGKWHFKGEHFHPCTYRDASKTRVLYFTDNEVFYKKRDFSGPAVSVMLRCVCIDHTGKEVACTPSLGPFPCSCSIFRNLHNYGKLEIRSHYLILFLSCPSALCPSDCSYAGEKTKGGGNHIRLNHKPHGPSIF